MFYFYLAGETVVSALCAHLRWRVRNSHERVACRLRTRLRAYPYAVSVYRDMFDVPLFGWVLGWERAL